MSCRIRKKNYVGALLGMVDELALGFIPEEGKNFLPQ
jgi:hypothetical protein